MSPRMNATLSSASLAPLADGNALASVGESALLPGRARRERGGDGIAEEGSDPDDAPVTNWAETVSARAEQFRHPETVEEVVELVRTNDGIRCSGALHSCAPLVASEGIILSLTRLEGIASIDPETRIVRAQAGVRMHDLCDALAPHGLAVGTLGTIDWQTLAGAVMTGTHGGALTVPSLHDYVRSYTLVTPDGDVMKVTKESDLNLFRAMAPSMGLFGAVVEMEMEVVPLEVLEARLTAVSFDDAIECFEDVMKSNKYARFVVYPSIGKATIWTANPVDSRDDAVANGAEDNAGYANFRTDDERAMLEEYLELCDADRFERADAVLERVVESQLSRLNHYVGRHNHVLCLERNNGMPHADIEFNFDFAEHGEVLRTVREYCDNARLPYYNFEIRTTHRDEAALSCCRGRDSMWIDFQAKADVSREFFEDVERVLRPLGFRKHWAKGVDNTDPAYLVEQFPQISEFVKLVKSFDPLGKFRNERTQCWLQSIEDILTKAAKGAVEIKPDDAVEKKSNQEERKEDVPVDETIPLTCFDIGSLY